MDRRREPVLAFDAGSVARGAKSDIEEIGAKAEGREEGDHEDAHGSGDAECIQVGARH